MKKILIIAVVLLLGGVVAVLLRQPVEELSDRELIEQAVSAMEQAAERRDLKALMSFIADSYHDPHGRDRNGLRAFLFGQMMLHSGGLPLGPPGEDEPWIRIFRRSTEIEIKEGWAQVQLKTLLARGTDARTVADLVPERTAAYQITLTMEKLDGRWLVTRGEHQRIHAFDLLR